jgi:hypothetical protein
MKTFADWTEIGPHVLSAIVILQPLDRVLVEFKAHFLFARVPVAW